MFRVLALCLVALASTKAMTTTTHKPHHTHGHHTHGPHVSKEPSEADNIRFTYEHVTHQMLLINQHNCYIVPLSDSEQTAVHTDMGIRTLELKLLILLATGTQTAVDIATMDKHVKHLCGHAQHIFTVA